MKQTMLLKLTSTTEQSQALLDTMHVFNAAYNYVARVAFAEKTAKMREFMTSAPFTAMRRESR